MVQVAIETHMVDQFDDFEELTLKLRFLERIPAILDYIIWSSKVIQNRGYPTKLLRKHV